VKLPGFGGLLGKELSPGLRFGTELSNRASFWAGVGGIFHTDELPGYGITEEEVKSARDRLGLGPQDAFVLVADEPSRAKDALNAVVERVQEAFEGVPEETRMAMPDGTTRYMRPRPGAARMYPETDVPPTPVTSELIAKLKRELPETPEQEAKRLMERYTLNQKLAKQLTESDNLRLFETLAASSRVQTTFIATTLTETCKSLEREGFPISDIPDSKVEAIFQLVDQGAMAKEAIAEMLKWQSKHPNLDSKDGIAQLGLRMLTEKELDAVLDRHVEKNRKLIQERGAGAFASLMGSVMSEVRGSIEPKVVTEKLKEKLSKIKS
jgi:glutamyl-tRNA(Gln) amidotransferase subunit E